jgi:hypothetical protein
MLWFWEKAASFREQYPETIVTPEKRRIRNQLNLDISLMELRSANITGLSGRH